LPFVLVADVLIGGGIGYWMDGRFHTSPLFLLVLGGAGFAAGMLQIVRSLSRRESRHDS
jgi:F0F1-type ATP synthase assembly protein I